MSVKRNQGVRDGEPHFAVIEVEKLSMEDGGSVGDSELEYIPCRTVQSVSKTAPYKLLPKATTDRKLPQRRRRQPWVYLDAEGNEICSEEMEQQSWNVAARNEFCSEEQKSGVKKRSRSEIPSSSSEDDNREDDNNLFYSHMSAANRIKLREMVAQRNESSKRSRLSTSRSQVYSSRAAAMVKEAARSMKELR